MDFEEFKRTHPYPDEDNQESLYRFMKVDRENINFLKDLFIHKKLFHNLVSSFNDPFEGKPCFSLKTPGNDANKIAKHLIELGEAKGLTPKELAQFNNFDEESLTRIISGGIESAYEHIRFCCFTTNKENLLFWSHYADSHRGFCIEFDASILPISLARKVQYSDDYPQFIYPVSYDERVLRPSLIKSPDWQYENEFRTCLSPYSKAIPNDGQSLYLHESSIINVYLGCKMESEDKEILLDILSDSPFKPTV